MFARLAIFLILLAATPAALALRCDGKLVNVGARDFQARQACGEPYWVDRIVDTEVIGAGQPVEYVRDVPTEVWYYNFGPKRLIVRLEFRDGVLIARDTLGYGVDVIGGDCPAGTRFDGLRVGEVYARCGAPMSRRVNDGYTVHRPGPGVERWREHRRETWTYDFGERRRYRVLHVVDGRVDWTEWLAR